VTELWAGRPGFDTQ